MYFSLGVVHLVRHKLLTVQPERELKILIRVQSNQKKKKKAVMHLVIPVHVVPKSPV